MPSKRVIIQRSVLPNLFRLEIFCFSDVIECSMKTKMTRGVRIRRGGTTFELQMRKDMIPQSSIGICAFEIWDWICKTTIELGLDTVSGTHALVETA